MNRSITFTPNSLHAVGAADLTYSEAASKDRAIYVLLQDLEPAPAPSRERFLLKTFRELVSRYMTFGAIEHPRDLIAKLVTFMEALSRRVDCRVDDFRGLGIYVVFQDADAVYVLTTRNGAVTMRLVDTMAPVAEHLPGVERLPLDSRDAQAELFSEQLSDFLACYRLNVAEDRPLDIVLGGTVEDHQQAVSTISAPGVVEATSEDAVLPSDAVDQKVLFVRFAPVEKQRDALSPLAVPMARRGWVLPKVGTVGLVAVTVAVASLATWLAYRTVRLPELANTQPVKPTETVPDRESTVSLQTERPPVQLLLEAPEAVERTAEAQGVSADSNDDVAQRDPDPNVSSQQQAEQPASSEGFNLEAAWRRAHDDAVTSTASVVGESVVYGCRDGNVYAVDPSTGDERWRHQGQAGVGASPRECDGDVVVADYAGGVKRLRSSTGEAVWKSQVAAKVVSSPVVANGEVVVAALDGVVYGVSAETGRRLWTFETDGRIRSSLAHSRGQYYVASYDGHLYALAAGTGALNWKSGLGGEQMSSPAADADIVVVGLQQGGVVAFDVADGSRRWKQSTVGVIKSFVRLDRGDVFVGSNSGKLHRLDAVTGKILWTADTNGPILAGAAVWDKNVVVPSYDGKIYAFDRESGKRVDQFAVGAPMFSSPVPWKDRVFVGTNKGEFVAITLAREH